MSQSFPLIDHSGKYVPVFLGTAAAPMHRWWWTALPALPRSRSEVSYRRLWRHFADHTMNTFKAAPEGVKPGNRGFYVEGREDHLVPAFLENFTLFPNGVWLGRMLGHLGIPVDGDIADFRWSYSYSEFIRGRGRPHADIVIMWRDRSGPAVLVIEAKKPGVRSLTDKDNPATGSYLHYSAMSRIERRFQALLADARDLPILSAHLPATARVISWQELTAIQISLAGELDADTGARALVCERLAAHHYRLGLTGNIPQAVVARADATRYTELATLRAPAAVTDWLIGSEVYFAAHLPGSTVMPPYAWLLDEPTITDYAARKTQTTAEREAPIWRLPADKVRFN